MAMKMKTPVAAPPAAVGARQANQQLGKSRGERIRKRKKK